MLESVDSLVGMKVVAFAALLVGQRDRRKAALKIFGANASGI